MKKHLLRIVMTAMCLALVGLGVRGGLGPATAGEPNDADQAEVEDFLVPPEDEVPPPEDWSDEDWSEGDVGCEAVPDDCEEDPEVPTDYPEYCDHPTDPDYDPEDCVPEYTPECADFSPTDPDYPEECETPGEEECPESPDCEPDYPTRPHFTG